MKYVDEDDGGPELVIERVRRRWQKQGRAAKVDASFRWSLACVPWVGILMSVLLGRTVHGTVLQLGLYWAAAGLALVQALLFKPLAFRALDHYLRRGPSPRLLVALSAILMAAVTALLFAVVGAVASGSAGGSGGESGRVLSLGAGAATGGSLVSFGAAASLLVRKRTYLTVLGVLAMPPLVLAALAGEWAAGASMVLTIAFIGLVSLSVGRLTGWILRLVWELDAAREAQAQLAVVEERLRFGRDMHDVLGRNLAVISLKSELAVKLARRGRAEAVDQMVEVQRIAQESQREVREVVRGYREADLKVELAGARSILQAAGVGCRIEGDGGEQLPAEAQSALGWVAREGTTNVLRHAPDAKHCVIRTRVTSGRAVLMMENDGLRENAPEPEAVGGGSGLRGLRERLAPLGGTLETERRSDGSYRLTAQLPVPAGNTSERGAG